MATLVFNAEDYVGERATTRTAAGNGGSGSSGNTDALERVDATKTYWRPEHHTDSAAYLRVENWLKDLEDLTFTGRRNQKPSSSNNNARSKTDSGNINASSASSASAPTSSAHIASRSYHLEADGDYDHEEDEQGLSYRATVPLSYEAGIALLRYFEEVKLFANIADQMQSQSQSQGEVELEADSKSAVAADKAIASSSPAAASRSASTSSSSSSSSSSAALRKPSKDVPALEDAAFFDRHWNEEVLKMWPQSETRRHWLAALVDLEKKLDAAIAPTLRLAPGRRRRSRKNWEEVKEKEEDGATRAANVALAASAGAAISAGGSTTTAAAAGTGGGGGAGAAAGEEEKKNADSSQAIARRGADGAGGGGGGAFVKLSVRSPKDAVFLLSRTQELIRSRLAGCSSSKISWTLNSTSDSPASSAAASVSPSTSSPSSPSPPAAASAAQADFLSQHDGHADAMALTDEVNAIHYACWQAMRCVSGTEALRLLLRSDRIYRDVLQHELFTRGDPQAFQLDIHIAPFFEGFHPDLEFRGFVVNGKRTALTAYNPWVYHPEIARHKTRDQIWKLIDAVWTQAESRIGTKTLNYSIDFALSESLSDCWLVELNNCSLRWQGAGCSTMMTRATTARCSRVSGRLSFESRNPRWWRTILLCACVLLLLRLRLRLQLIRSGSLLLKLGHLLLPRRRRRRWQTRQRRLRLLLNLLGTPHSNNSSSSRTSNLRNRSRSRSVSE